MNKENKPRDDESQAIKKKDSSSKMLGPTSPYVAGRKSPKVCFICDGEHRPRDCRLWPDVKAITLARLRTMPDSMRVMIL